MCVGPVLVRDGFRPSRLTVTFHTSDLGNASVTERKVPKNVSDAWFFVLADPFVSVCQRKDLHEGGNKLQHWLGTCCAPFLSYVDNALSEFDLFLALFSLSETW